MRKSGVEIYSQSEASLALEEYQRGLARFFTELIEEWGPSVVFASDNGVKRAALEFFLGQFGDSSKFKELRLTSQNPDEPEPALSSSALAALSKGRLVKQQAGNRGEHTLFIAGDVISQEQNPRTGKFSPSHKLARRMSPPLTERQREIILTELINKNENPYFLEERSGLRRAIWSVSSAIVNGSENVPTNIVEVRYHPIDRELLTEVFEIVADSGLALHINTIIPLLETAMLSGVQTVAVAPGHLVERFGIESYRRDVKNWQVPVPESELRTGRLDMEYLAQRASSNYWASVLINVLGNVPALLDN